MPMAHRHRNQYLRTARIAACLSQAELGALLGASERVVRNVEKGISLPSYAFVLGSTLLFGKSSDRLFPYLYNSVQEGLGEAGAALDERLRGHPDPRSLKKLALLSAMAARTIAAPRIETICWILFQLRVLAVSRKSEG